MIEVLDTGVGSVKQRERGFGRAVTDRDRGGVAGRGDFLAGLDRQHADAVEQRITRSWLSSTAAVG